nr:elongation factor P [Candidatus Aenigmarchaeota archaeon]
FDQFSLSKEDLDDKIWYLKDGSEVEIEYYKEKPIGINLPIKMNFRVKKAEKGEKGDRVSSGTKPITLETGLIIQAPLFINEKDVVRIDTRDGSYVERAK